MAERKINIVQGKNYIESFADAFQVMHNAQRGFVEVQLCEEVPIMPEECVINEDGSLSIAPADSPYVATRIVNARIKMPVDAAARLGELLVATKASEKQD